MYFEYQVCAVMSSALVLEILLIFALSTRDSVIKQKKDRL